MLVSAASALASAAPPPFQGHTAPGTVLITARDYSASPPRAIIDRAPGAAEELSSAFRIGDGIVMKVRIYNHGLERHDWTVYGFGEFRQPQPSQFNEEPPPPVVHPVYADPVTHELGWFEVREFDLVIRGVPDTVLRGELELYVIITGPFVGQIGAWCPWYVYRIAGDPVAPMEAPWTEVLDDACLFAAGATNDDQVFDLSTFYLYHSFKFAYDGKRAYYYDWYKGSFNLTKLVDNDRDNATYPVLAADCQAVSAYLHLLVNALGVEAGLVRLQGIGASGYQDPYWTNPICPIGSDADMVGSYAECGWIFHQVTTKSGVSLSRVYDACAAQKWNLAGGPYWNPPRDWALGAYWQTPNPGIPGRPEAFFGLVDRLAASQSSHAVQLNTEAASLDAVL